MDWIEEFLVIRDRKKVVWIGTLLGLNKRSSTRAGNFEVHALRLHGVVQEPGIKQCVWFLVIGFMVTSSHWYLFLDDDLDDDGETVADDASD